MNEPVGTEEQARRVLVQAELADRIGLLDGNVVVNLIESADVRLAPAMDAASMLVRQAVESTSREYDLALSLSEGNPALHDKLLSVVKAAAQERAELLTEALKAMRSTAESDPEEGAVTQTSTPSNHDRRQALIKENRAIRDDVARRRQRELAKSRLRRLGDRLVGR